VRKGCAILKRACSTRTQVPSPPAPLRPTGEGASASRGSCRGHRAKMAYPRIVTLGESPAEPERIVCD